LFPLEQLRPNVTRLPVPYSLRHFRIIPFTLEVFDELNAGFFCSIGYDSPAVGAEIKIFCTNFVGNFQNQISSKSIP
jgi:hypothetical protein